VVYTNVYAEIELLKVKVPLIYLGTEGVSARREGRYTEKVHTGRVCTRKVKIRKVHAGKVYARKVYTKKVHNRSSGWLEQIYSKIAP
jgi:hypothetical protein